MIWEGIVKSELDLVILKTFYSFLVFEMYQWTEKFQVCAVWQNRTVGMKENSQSV